MYNLSGVSVQWQSCLTCSFHTIVLSVESTDGAFSHMVLGVEAFTQLSGGAELIGLYGAPPVFRLKYMLNEKHC